MLSYCKVYQFHDSSTEGPLRQACPVETANYLRSHGNNLPSFLLFLRENYKDAYNRIVDYVRDVVPGSRTSIWSPWVVSFLSGG
ncbi:hypothetical protein NXX09_20740 [Bacteroides uniformis]|nr:hypothetical protein [Bacteroides uniformis]